jgi:hypothetical protein
VKSVVDLTPNHPEQLAALVIVTSFAAGLNVYATAATLGLLARLGLVNLPMSLEPVSHWWVIGLCGFLYVIEFFADKIPAFDLVWNTLQTFVRVPAGALLAYGAMGHTSPIAHVLATALGGAIAFAAHGAKTAARVAVTPSPELFSNIALSTGEDALAIGLTWLSTQHPFWAAGIVIGLLAAIVALAGWIVRAIRTLIRRRHRTAS